MNRHAAPELKGNAKEAWDIFSRLPLDDQKRVNRYIEVLLTLERKPTPEAQRINDELQQKINAGATIWGELDSYLDAIEEALTGEETA